MTLVRRMVVVAPAVALAAATGCATPQAVPALPATASTPPPATTAPSPPPPTPPASVTPPPSPAITMPSPSTAVAPSRTPPPDPARAKLDEARALVGRGDMAGAVPLLRQALRLAPDLAEARATLGLALYAMGDLDAAVDELRGLLRARPDLAEARLTLAAALVARQEWPAARAELEEALRRQPDLVQAQYTLGVVRYAQGDLAGAIDAYRAVLAREPAAHDARYNLALVLKLARRDAEAAPELLTAAEAGLARAQYFAGAAYATGAGVERDLVLAITWWTRAAEQGVAQADEALAQLRQTASGRNRRAPAERQAIEQAFAEYRARIATEYADVPREGDEPVGAALLRQGRAPEAVAVLIREASALSEPAQRLLETLSEQGINDARVPAYLKSAAAEGRLRPRPRP
ncbi:MAG TPA: tetratricopeptide repeat protein [Methylomirabilota bacterium]|nr:tetratricopeptide repeat protein [Methylomirabilota bacterium]